MKQKQKAKKDVYVCGVCGAISDQPQECCGKPMKKSGTGDCNC